MTVFELAEQQFLDALAVAANGAALDATLIVTPPDPAMGDLAFPCFALAKTLKKAPPQIAKELAERIELGGLIGAVEAVGPYVNARFDRPAFAAAVRKEIADAKEAYGVVAAPTGRKVMIEYGSLNTHKEVHVGHLRNYVLGLAVERLLRATGDDVTPVAYVGDIGAHVAKCLWAFRKHHADEVLPENRGKYLGSVYTEATRLVEEDPARKDEVAAVQRALESRDAEWNSLWERTREWCIEELDAISKELGISFARTYFESEVEQPGKDLVARLVADGVAQTGEGGAIIVDLSSPEDLGVFLLLKSDGAALYSTKELALAYLKQREYGDLDESVHVVDARQSLYFKQLFATLKRLGFPQALTHLSYEFVTLSEGAMSSRKGNVVAYEDFRDEMIRRVTEETASRHEDWDAAKIAVAARAIAFGAMKFGMLKQDNDRPIVFDMDEALAAEGFSGPYLQYAHARLASILRKAGADAADATASASAEIPEAEHVALAAAARLPSVIRATAKVRRPSQLAQSLFDLAQASNAFYRDVPVLSAEGDVRAQRLATVVALKTALKNGMQLLGMDAPEEM